MNELLEPSAATALAVALIIVVLVIIVFHVFTSNYRQLRRHMPPPDLLDGERQLDELNIHQALSSARMTLTDRRVVIQRVSWPFTGISQRGVALGDLHGVTWRSGLSILLFVLALAALAYVRPVGLLLLMLALEVTVCSVTMVSSFASMPFSRPGLTVISRAYLPDLHRFFRNAQMAWAGIRAAHSGTTYSPVAGRSPSTRDLELVGFAWGRAVWIGILAIMLAALAQRLVTEAVSYDHLAFAPLFLGIPIGIAKRSMREGAWAAILSVLAVFSVKFPADGLSQGHAFPLQLLIIMAGMVTMALVGGLLGRHVHPLATIACLVLWPGVVALDGGPTTLDLRVLAITLLAMAVAAVVPWPAGRDSGVSGAQAEARDGGA